MLKFVVMLSLFFSLPALSKRIELSKVYTDIDEDIVTFYMHLDQNDKIDSISYITKNAQGRIIKERDWTYNEVANGGVVLDERNGYEILKLEMGKGFNRNTGGAIALNYLFNGATNSRKFVNFEVKRVLGEYKLFHSDKVVNELRVQGNIIPVLGLVGIRFIQINFTK